MIRPRRPRTSPPGEGVDRQAAGWVCVGVITKPKGVRGEVRIAAHTARPGDVAAYGPVYDRPDGQTLGLEVCGSIKGGVVARIAGCDDRDAAEALRGTKLFVPRAALPETEEDEYYYADLIGLTVEAADGGGLGTVRAVHDFGAGDILEVARAGGGEAAMVPFTGDVVPVVDIAGGRLVVSRLGDMEE